MAAAGIAPTADPLAGASALDEDISRVLKLESASSVEALGWSRPNRSTLLVPMRGIRMGVTDEYLLRLTFQAYRKWPPGAQFVNPETKAYVYPQDQHHVPILTSPECQTHVAYPRNPGTIQLVCCSATMEFYEVQHGVDAQHLWRETNTFLTTIVAIRRAFASHYQGRFPVHGR